MASTRLAGRMAWQLPFCQTRQKCFVDFSGKRPSSRAAYTEPTVVSTKEKTKILDVILNAIYYFLFLCFFLIEKQIRRKQLFRYK